MPMTPRYTCQIPEIYRIELYSRDIYYAKYYDSGGEWPAGEKMKLGVREKNEKGKRKKEENFIKKGLKNASFWAINSKNFMGGSSDPPRNFFCYYF